MEKILSIETNKGIFETGDEVSVVGGDEYATIKSFEWDTRLGEIQVTTDKGITHAGYISKKPFNCNKDEK